MDALHLAQRLGSLSQVRAVALAGSRGAGRSDAQSDVDLYVYCDHDVPIDFRRAMLGPLAEIDNRFWEPGDEAVDPETGTSFDLMYRSPAWIEDKLDRVLVRTEASIGYSTCLWFNVLNSEALFDRTSWYPALQARARVPYPEALRRAVVAKNWPILRRNQSAYRRQIHLALARRDEFSAQHRVTMLLASFFDIWFALERQPHPGEKRLLTWLPLEWRARVAAVVNADREKLLEQVDALLDPLDARLRAEELIP